MLQNSETIKLTNLVGTGVRDHGFPNTDISSMLATCKALVPYWGCQGSILRTRFYHNHKGGFFKKILTLHLPSGFSRLMMKLNGKQSNLKFLLLLWISLAVDYQLFMKMHLKMLNLVIRNVEIKKGALTIPRLNKRFWRGRGRNCHVDQGAARYTNQAYCSRGWRRYRVQKLQRWHSIPQNARLLHKLSELCGHFEKWRPKHASILHTGGIPTVIKYACFVR